MLRYDTPPPPPPPQNQNQTSDPKIVIHGNECIILFLTRYFMSWTHNPAKTIIDRSFCNCRQRRWFLAKHCDVTIVDLWRHANARYYHCDVIFVDCSRTRKLALRRSSLVNNNNEYWSHHPVFTAGRVRKYHLCIFHINIALQSRTFLFSSYCHINDAMGCLSYFCINHELKKVFNKDPLNAFYFCKQHLRDFSDFEHSLTFMLLIYVKWCYRL